MATSKTAVTRAMEINQKSLELARGIDDLTEVESKEGLFVAEDADLSSATLFVDLRDDSFSHYASKDNIDEYLREYDIPASVKLLEKKLRGQGSKSLGEYA